MAGANGMMIKVTDSAQQTVYIDPTQISIVIVPNQFAMGGPGFNGSTLCKVLVGSVAVDLPRSETERLLKESGRVVYSQMQ